MTLRAAALAGITFAFIVTACGGGGGQLVVTPEADTTSEVATEAPSAVDGIPTPKPVVSRCPERALMLIATSPSAIAPANTSASTSIDGPVSDATSSDLPNTFPRTSIYIGHSPPYATPRSMLIFWPLSVAIGSTTLGTSTFSIWALANGNPEAHILVNGRDAGEVAPGEGYDWLSLEFPTSYLDQGVNNMIEIWTEGRGSLLVAADGPQIDDVGEENPFYLCDNGGEANVDGGRYGGPRYGIYARLTVR